MQALYQIDVGGASVEEALEQFLSHSFGTTFDEADTLVRPNKELFTELVRGVRSKRDQLGEMLDAGLAGTWRLDRLEVVLRCILETGAYELVGRNHVPARVVITEYVDLAHAFYAGTEPGMVNGILDKLARVLRPGELGLTDTEKDTGGFAPTTG